MNFRAGRNKQLAAAVTLAVMGMAAVAVPQQQAWAAASHGEENAPLTYEAYLAASTNGDIKVSSEACDGTDIYVAQFFDKRLTGTTITLGSITVEGIDGAAGRGERPQNPEAGDQPVIAGLAAGSSTVIGVADSNVKDLTISITAGTEIIAVGGDGQNDEDKQKGGAGLDGTTGTVGLAGVLGTNNGIGGNGGGAATATTQAETGGLGAAGTDGGAGTAAGISLQGGSNVVISGSDFTVVGAGGDGAAGGDGGQGGTGANGGNGGAGAELADGALSTDHLTDQGTKTINGIDYSNIADHNGLNGVNGNGGGAGGNAANGAAGGNGADGGHGAKGTAVGLDLSNTAAVL